MEVFKNETKRRELVNNLQSLSAGDRVHMLRAMPLSLAEKTKLRCFVSRLVQRSLHPKFPAVVEGGSEEVVWPLRHWCALLLPLPQNSSALQRLPLPHQQPVPGLPPGHPPAPSHPQLPQSHRHGAVHRHRLSL